MSSSISGRRSAALADKLFGRLSKVTAATGERVWTNSYDGGGSKWVKNECFGLQTFDDGSAILACGTGIEVSPWSSRLVHRHRGESMGIKVSLSFVTSVNLNT